MPKSPKAALSVTHSGTVLHAQFNKNAPRGFIFLKLEDSTVSEPMEFHLENDFFAAGYNPARMIGKKVSVTVTNPNNLRASVESIKTRRFFRTKTIYHRPANHPF